MSLKLGVETGLDAEDGRSDGDGGNPIRGRGRRPIGARFVSFVVVVVVLLRMMRCQKSERDDRVPAARRQLPLRRSVRRNNIRQGGELEEDKTNMDGWNWMKVAGRSYG